LGCNDQLSSIFAVSIPKHVDQIPANAIDVIMDYVMVFEAGEFD
jgi:hypothetical protein